MKLLERRSLSASDFAERLGVSPGMVSRYLRTSDPSEVLLDKITHILQLTEEEKQELHRFRREPIPLSHSTYLLRRREAERAAYYSQQVLQMLLEEMGWVVLSGKSEDVLPYSYKIHPPGRRIPFRADQCNHT